jgi:hypothetical protein
MQVGIRTRVKKDKEKNTNYGGDGHDDVASCKLTMRISTLVNITIVFDTIVSVENDSVVFVADYHLDFYIIVASIMSDTVKAV